MNKKLIPKAEEQILIPKCGIGSLIGKVAKHAIKPKNITLSSRTNPNDHFIDLIFQQHPELAQLGTKKQYAKYISQIFPKSKKKQIVWHGSNSDFSKGFDSAVRGTGSGSPHMASDMYFGSSPSSTLQYVNDVNVPFQYRIGETGHWNKLHWIPKEIMGKGRYNETEWMNLPWEKAIRQEIPMNSGRLKPIQEFKESIGLGDLSDQQFFKKLGFKKGESFNQWKKRNKKKFNKLEKEGKIQGSNPAIVDVRNPYIESNMGTYYHERPISQEYDTRYNLHANNEFWDDVTIMLNHPENRIHWLGSEQDMVGFKSFLGLKKGGRLIPRGQRGDGISTLLRMG